MSSDVVIRAQGLGKKYVIGHQAEREQYVALRDVIARNARNLGRTAMDLVRGRPSIVGDELEEFWALKDVDFEIRRGEVVGVIGRNGAGKSTLLKILSRITEPSEGRVEIKGRVASLLEVGTGFHPELSGRENIYLNGAILGMSRAEIRRKFDEIVAFSEIEKFLDTPVKRYSSGMYVRLAFAVAAHLEPEILIVDEVLAVGDAEFQKKCLGKMQDVAGHGRTVLFVSHNMSAIQALCGRGLYLDRGKVGGIGSVSSVIDTYLAEAVGPIGARDITLSYENSSAPKSGGPWVVKANIITPMQSPSIEYGSSIEIQFLLRSNKKTSSIFFSFQICNELGNPIIHLFPKEEISFEGNPDGKGVTLTCEIPFLRLNTGRYRMSVHLSGPPGSDHYETLDNLCPFEIVRLKDHYQWGWRSDTCVYFEDSAWSIETESSCATRSPPKNISTYISEKI